MKLVYAHQAWSEDNYLAVHLDTGDVVYMRASCNVRNNENGRRKPNQVIYSMPDNHPYQPSRIVSGTFKIGLPVRRTQDDRAPYFIPCDAFITTPIWELDHNHEYAFPTQIMTRDIGYGLHCSTWVTTLGCVKIHSEKDLLLLVNLILDVLSNGREVLLEVI